jgi:HrpA-like RNA helicase
MDMALSVLEELGATDSSGALTALGRHMVCYTFVVLQHSLTFRSGNSTS